jgi:hypothetical protein
MHQFMVKPLPRKCRLTAIFDVSYINNMIRHTSILLMFCSLAIVVVFLVRRPISMVLIMTHCIQGLPHLVRNTSHSGRFESP